MTVQKADEAVRRILGELEAQMDPMVLRTHPKFKVWTGVGGRRMANLDCLGLGPRERVLVGKQVAYPKAALLEWIAARLQAA